MWGYSPGNSGKTGAWECAGGQLGAGRAVPTLSCRGRFRVPPSPAPPVGQYFPTPESHGGGKGGGGTRMFGAGEGEGRGFPDVRVPQGRWVLRHIWRGFLTSIPSSSQYMPVPIPPSPLQCAPRCPQSLPVQLPPPPVSSSLPQLTPVYPHCPQSLPVHSSPPPLFPTVFPNPSQFVPVPPPSASYYIPVSLSVPPVPV